MSHRNAVHALVAPLSRRDLAAALSRCGAAATPDDDTEVLRSRLARRFELDLAGLLNRLARSELDRVAGARELDGGGSVGELRARLWLHGARLEAGGDAELGAPWQPTPIVLGGKLVHQGPERGLAAPGDRPRPIPPEVPEPAASGEPDTLEELLARATGLVGVRLGRRGRDKGAHGSRIAALLGVPERGYAEPDWRGEVEIKTVPVVRDPSGWWRVKEDPAVAMEGVEPRRKLGRVLWIARVADAGDSPILSWYYQEWDQVVARLAARDLHQRPKGGAGATTRGWYLHKRFFTDSGFLRSLNG